MQTLEVKFPARRYHATPWDAHVNEGRIEWPPCPWRLVRAMIAVGYGKLAWSNPLPEQAVTLIEKLCGCTPQYRLPQTAAAHTRHYMPYNEGSKEKKAKVFDTFLKLTDPDAVMLIRYDIQLNEDERELLEELVASLAYLGRAESWVEACLLDIKRQQASDAAEWIAVARPGERGRTRLLAPMAPADFDPWREAEVEAAVAQAESVAEQDYAERNKKFTPAQRMKIRIKTEAPYPGDLVTALQQENQDWQKAGWPRPPGSQWLDYALPDNLFERQPLTPIATNRTFEKPTAILLAIDGEGKRGTLRPSMKRALPLMELLHSESIRYATRELKFGHLPELMGTTADGKPVRGQHSHAHWLPLSFFGKGKIDHVLVYASAGFSKESVQAISRIRWAFAKRQNKLSVNMVGQGRLSDVYQQLASNGKVSLESLSVLRSARTFVSCTPIVLRKYLSHGKKSFEGQIREELTERGLPEPASVERVSNQEMVDLNLKGFLLRRNRKKNQPRSESSWAARIRFDSQISNPPITLGYASHFGLGMFRAE